MKNQFVMRTSLLLFLTILASHSIAGEGTNPFTSIEKKDPMHPSVGHWFLVDPKWNYVNSGLFDNSPSTRQVAQSFLISQTNLSASAVSGAHRFHIDFESGGSAVTKEIVQDV